MNRDELLWAGGLFEGEGSISSRLIYGRAKSPAAQLRLAMTDEDSVRRFHRAVGLGTVHGPYQPTNPAHKPHWVWACSGFERVQAVLAMLWTGLGARRRDRASALLAATRDRKLQRGSDGRFTSALSSFGWTA